MDTPVIYASPDEIGSSRSAVSASAVTLPDLPTVLTRTYSRDAKEPGAGI